jgi:RES domain-containing protein
MTLAWRLVREKYAGNPLSADGARIYGGRWNEAGVEIVYSSENRSLAALEVLVHLNGVYPSWRYKLLEYMLDDRLIEDVAPANLPGDWREEPAPLSITRWGTEWAKAGRSVALRVPSAVVPDEKNIILNPHHKEIGRVIFGVSTDFAFDPRLFAARK